MKYFIPPPSEPIDFRSLELPRPEFVLGDPVEITFEGERRRGRIGVGELLGSSAKWQTALGLHQVEFARRGKAIQRWFRDSEIQHVSAVDQLAAVVEGRRRP